MSLTGIIAEIDAYLARLHRARELLLASTVEGRRDITPPPKSEVKLRKPVPDIRSTARVQGNESRPRRRHPERKVEDQRADSGSPDVISVRREARVPKQPRTSAAASPPRRVGENEAVSLTEPRPPIILRGRRRSPRHSGTKQDKTVPAIALASPKAPRIVVVSAELVKQQKDRAALSQTRPQRVPAGDSTGRRAFEALFRD
jgi:hypothetical protein